jgi:hypothetical protein
MHIGFAYVLLVIAGAAAVCWGLPASHRLKRPYDIAAALAVLAGVACMMLGILLTFIPDFFR